MGLMLLAVGARGERVEEAPQALRLQLYEAYTELEIEGQMDERSTIGSRNQYDYLYIVPSLGLGLRGSVYHPYLLTFRLAPQLGYSWQWLERTPPGDAQHDGRLLQRYHADVTALQKKPYATSLYADQDITYQDFDFFTRARVDSLRLGGSTGYQAGPIPFRLTYAHREEDNTGLLTGDRGRKEDTLTFSARNDRGKMGRTEASYQWQEYTTSTEGVPPVEGTSHSLGLTDWESLGTDHWITLNSVGSFLQMDQAMQSTRSLTANENLRLQHEPNLASTYEYDFANSQSGESDSDSHSASASLQHKLYESLTSSIAIGGEQYRSSSPGNRLESRRYGVRVSEQYTKQLGRLGRISLGYSCGIGHEQRDTSGAVLVVVDEPHTLTDGVVTTLRNPGVDPSTVVVTDATGTIFYLEGLDYLVYALGQLTEIRRLAGGAIPNGGSVLVDYSAVLQPSDEFDTLDQQANFRLGGQLLDVYGHLRELKNFGGETLVLDDISDRVIGIETNWKGLRAGAEYQEYDSTFSSYRAVRLFESFSFQATENTWLSCDSGQGWSRFIDTDESQTTYHVIGRLNTRLTSFLRYSLEGGMRWERGDQIDQDLMTVRTNLDFDYAQLRIRLSYEYTDRDVRGDLQQRHYFVLRARRDF